MNEQDVYLGIDASTQSLTAVAISAVDGSQIAQARIRYRDHPGLAGYGLTGAAPILPPREDGEADQPAGIFLDALELVFLELGRDILSRVSAIDISAQQHGQVFVAEEGLAAIASLGRSGWDRSGQRLSEIIVPGLATERSPIWMSSQTSCEAAEIREALGGSEAVTRVSGSDSPLRFSGAVLRHVGKKEPGVYGRIAKAHLISSFLAGVLAAFPDAPIDWGNGSGMSLMNWSGRTWDPRLVAAVASGLPGGDAGLVKKLPGITHPLSRIGTVSAYFRERFGFSGTCSVIAGSGDNPQGKVLAEGALLSLGTSYVLMTEGLKPHVAANAMYDGLGRPFLFGCRTNGSLLLESVRLECGLSADDFRASDDALAAIPTGGNAGDPVMIFQTDAESFPASPPMRTGHLHDFKTLYPAIVDSTLGLLVLGSLPFSSPVSTIAVTGGAAASRRMLERVATLWGKPAIPIGEAGAAAGAAVAAGVAMAEESMRGKTAARLRSGAAKPGTPVLPDESLSEAIRAPGGYLDKLARAFRDAGGLSI